MSYNYEHIIHLLFDQTWLDQGALVHKSAGEA